MIAARSTTGQEAGSTLLLFPAALLVVILLGTIAVDLSAVHLARRTALRAASEAADDAAAAIDVDELHRTGAVRLDRDAARRVATAEAEALLGPALRSRPQVDVDPDGRVVQVTVIVEATAVFGVVGGIERTVEVTAIGRLVDTA